MDRKRRDALAKLEEHMGFKGLFEGYCMKRVLPLEEGIWALCARDEGHEGDCDTGWKRGLGLYSYPKAEGE